MRWFHSYTQYVELLTSVKEGLVHNRSTGLRVGRSTSLDCHVKWLPNREVVAGERRVAEDGIREIIGMIEEIRILKKEMQTQKAQAQMRMGGNPVKNMFRCFRHLTCPLVALESGMNAYRRCLKLPAKIASASLRNTKHLQSS
jgi:hypothetical protein